MKIAMITPGYLPVPAVKGGAVEVLIEELLKGNEIENKCTIDCYTIDDENIQKRGYRNTNIKVVNIKTFTRIKNKIHFFSFYIANKKIRRIFGQPIQSKKDKFSIN